MRNNQPRGGYVRIASGNAQPGESTSTPPVERDWGNVVGVGSRRHVARGLPARQKSGCRLTWQHPIGQPHLVSLLLILAGLEPAIFGSEEQRLIH